ncbi:MAG: hypothetical protein ACI9Y1_001678 [Lentisphaeria bacterium]
MSLTTKRYSSICAYFYAQQFTENLSMPNEVPMFSNSDIHIAQRETHDFTGKGISCALPTFTTAPNIKLNDIGPTSGVARSLTNTHYFTFSIAIEKAQLAMPQYPVRLWIQNP